MTVLILLLFLVNRLLFMKWMEKDVSVSAEWEDFKGYRHNAVLDPASISLVNDILKNRNDFDRMILPRELGCGTSLLKICYYGKMMNSVYDCYGNGMVITRGRFLPIWLSIWKTDSTKIDDVLNIIMRNEEGEEAHLSLTSEDN